MSKTSTTVKTPRGSKKSIVPTEETSSTPSITSSAVSHSTEVKVLETTTPTPPTPSTKRPRSKKSEDVSSVEKKVAVAEDASAVKPVEVPVVVIEPTISVNAELANIEILEGSGSQSPLDQLRQRNQTLVTQITSLTTSLGKLRRDFISLDQAYAREFKLLAKQSSSKKGMKKKAGNRAPSGFVRPTKISDEMAQFLDKPSGSEVARTDVTRAINKYIIDNDLQDKTNRRRILADGPLRALLQLGENDELTYFNLQKHMKGHFQKITPDVVAAPVASVEVTA